MKGQSRAVAAIKSDALKDLAIADATLQLRHKIHLFDPAHGLEDNRRINNEGIVRLYETILKIPPGADEWITGMIQDAESKWALRAIAADLIKRGKPLPESLRGWCAETISRRTARQRGKRGPDPFARRSRDVVIMRTVYWIAEQYGFHKLRNRATQDAESWESACSIVSEALDKIGHPMSEQNVEKIVEKRSAQSRRSRTNS